MLGHLLFLLCYVYEHYCFFADVDLCGSVDSLKYCEVDSPSGVKTPREESQIRLPTVL